MGNNRSKVPDLEKLVKGGRKKFVRYEEGAMLYSMGVHTFQQLAKDARAVYHVKRIVLVNLDLIDEYLEAFLCKELIPGYLNGITGEYAPPAGYLVNEKEAEAFDREFPYMEKKKLLGQIFE